MDKKLCDAAGFDEKQLSEDVVAAYREAAYLADAGWLVKRLEFDAHTATATVVAATPTRRTVTVSWDLRGDRVARHQVPARAIAVQLLQLAYAVATMGQCDAEDGQDRLDQLCWLVSSRIGSARRRRWWCADPIPGSMELSVQGRGAAWLIARLTVKYGWWIGHLGEDIAGGGFIADIPGDVLAVFPAAISDDGTAAAALARLVPTLSGPDRQLLTHLDYRLVWSGRRR